MKIRADLILLAILLLPSVGLAYSITFSDSSSETIRFWIFNIKPEASIGEVFTGLSIIVSIIVFSITFYNNNQQKRKEYEKDYADRIRNSAGEVIAKLNSWRKFNLIFFKDIQNSIEETDEYLVETKDFRKAGSFLSEKFDRINAKSNHTILSEQTEKAFKDLYGFKPVTNDLLITLNQFEYINRFVYSVIQRVTGDEIVQMHERYKIHEDEALSGEIKPLQLAYRLRMTISRLQYIYDDLMKGVIDPFFDEMIHLIGESDNEIYKSTEKFKKRKSAEQDNRTNAQEFALTGLYCCYKHDYRESGRWFCRAIELTPNIPGFWAGVSLALWELDNTKVAEEAFNIAIELLPGGPKIIPKDSCSDERLNATLRKVKRALNMEAKY